ncbi:hypothetical protein GO491_01530 [Flavobacteriaceae bacterium Ap0902]|nr:hypothetical protein [Flavobacteriaceae bacterium Ap0902]
MTKWLDYFLIIALAVNIIMSLLKYEPTTEVMGATIPTWVALAIQVACIGLIIYKRMKMPK